MPADPVRTLGIPPCGSIAWRKPALLHWARVRRAQLLADIDSYGNSFAWKRRLHSVERKIARLQAELIEEELRAAPVPEQERKAA